MISVYVRQSHQVLRRWVTDPRLQRIARWAAHALAGFCLSAASLGQGMLPLTMGFVWTCRGFGAVLAAVGGGLGYWFFWGQGGLQGMVWTFFSLLGALFLADRRLGRELPLLIPAVGMLTVSAAGLGFQILAGDLTPVWLYLLRVALGGASPWLFRKAREQRDPLMNWLSWGLVTLALAQIAPVHWLGLGFVAAGIAAVAGPFPCGAVVGLALDLAGITPLPMTAVTVLAWLVRLLPVRRLRFFAPGAMALAVMGVCSCWDPAVLPGLMLGGLVGVCLPGQIPIPHRGQTGAAQVQLELAAGTLSQFQQLLLETPPPPVDREGLWQQALSDVCRSCSHRRSCHERRILLQLQGELLEQPLAEASELPVQCRRCNRLLQELHRAQVRLRSLRADRQRQEEYRQALVQQYGFLSEYLQSLSDRLPRQQTDRKPAWEPRVQIWGNRPREDNGDRCLHFSGMQGKYYVLLCDGMGTGPGAVRAGNRAAVLLRRMLLGGFPAEYALGSLNSLYALTEQAGAVTVDLAEVSPDTGKVTLYKWGAAPSWHVGKHGADRLGRPDLPPGLSATGTPQVCRITLRKDQVLILISDGISREQLPPLDYSTPQDLARHLLAQTEDRDDATVVTVQLVNTKNEQ